MNSAVQTPYDLEPQTTYRVYHDGQQVDEIRFITVNPESGVGHVVIGDYDTAQEIDLKEWVNEYALVARHTDTASMDTVRPPLP